MAKKRFTATVTGSGPMAIDIPESVLTALGGKRVPVVVVVNGHNYRTTTAVMSGRNLIGFSKANCVKAGLVEGTKVTVTIENDTESRVVEAPTELVTAFKKNKPAKTTWEALSYSHQKEYARWITEAKKAETRDRRVTKAIEMLAAGSKTPR